MTEKRDKPGPIKPPSHDHPDDKLRTVATAAIELIPGGGSIARLAGEVVPTQAERARRHWEGNISDRTNEHTARLDEHDQLIAPKKSITGLTAALAVALAKAPGDGMRGKGREPNDVAALLPDNDSKAVHEAAFELQDLGLVQIQRAIGKHWWLYLDQNFYEQVDHQVMGWNTYDDAKSLAKLMLEDDGRAVASKLHEASGWDKRRFNPAFRFLLNELPAERVSKEIQPNYPSSYVMLLPEDRARLKRFSLS